jgi:hypothetical protein
VDGELLVHRDDGGVRQQKVAAHVRRIPGTFSTDSRLSRFRCAASATARSAPPPAPMETHNVVASSCLSAAGAVQSEDSVTVNVVRMEISRGSAAAPQ